jgi:threonine dehydratase
MLTLEDIQAARERIAPYVLYTPLLHSPALSELLGMRVSLKYELFQVTASFKPRGAFNKALSLSDEQRARGILAVSGGNHGKAVAHMARRLGLRALVLMPETAAPSAMAAVRADGAELRIFPTAAEAFEAARALEAEGLTFIHPYADQLVVAGQGTLGLEIAEQAPDCTDLIASIGGGGMIGGLALALKALRPGVRVWGVEPEGADALTQALAADRSVPLTISSVIATLSAPIASELTLELAKRYIDEIICLPDRAAIADVLVLLDQAHLLAEPAAAITLSAARQLRERLTPGGHLVLVICGASITMAELANYRARFGV